MNKCYATILLAALVTSIGATADAAVVATMQEVGSDIVVSGGGQVNLAGLTADGSSSATAGMTPGNPSIGFGAAPSLGLPVDRYTGVTPPSTFGAGLGAGADTGNGDRFVAFPTQILVPDGYLSNAALAFSNTYLNSSFASIVITPGTYVWTWGSDANVDSFTLNIVPEPASAALLALGGVALLRRRRSVGPSRKQYPTPSPTPTENRFIHTPKMIVLTAAWALFLANHVAAEENLLIIDLAPTGINQTPWGQSSLNTIEPVLRMHVYGADTNADPDIVRFDEGAFKADFGVSVGGGAWRDVMQTQQGAGFEFDLSTLSAPQFERLINVGGNDVSLSGTSFSAFDRSLNNAFIQGGISGARASVLTGGITSLVIDVAPTGINQTPWGQSSLSTIASVLRMHVHGIDTDPDPDIVRFEEGAFSADFAVDFADAGWREIMQTQQGAGFEFDLSTLSAPQFERLINGSGNDVSLSGGAFSAFDRSLNNAFIQGNIAAVQYIPEPASAALLAIGGLALSTFRRQRKPG